jgi:nicotinamide riboside transporter PnuC
LGIGGATLLALNIKHSPYGFVLFLISSLFIIWFSIEAKAYGILAMQIAYAFINILGIYRWILPKFTERE